MEVGRDEREEGRDAELTSQDSSGSLFTLELTKAWFTLTTSSLAFSEWHWPLRAYGHVPDVCGWGKGNAVSLGRTCVTHMGFLPWGLPSLWGGVLLSQGLQEIIMPDSTACPHPHPSPGTSLLAGDSGVLGFRTATGGGRGLLARVAITWPWAFNSSWGVTAWTCRLWAGAGAATLAEFTTHGSVPIT